MNKSLFNNLFVLRGRLNDYQRFVLGAVGIGLLLLLWYAVVATGMVAKQILPSPLSVIGVFPELHYQDLLVRNVGYSLKLNISGYAYAILLGLPIGFLLGLSPFFRGLGAPFFNGLRYLPLSAATGLFIMWFGIEDAMKVSFLAFAIFVYLVPTVVQRVDEVRSVYLNTAKTIGANWWQTIRYVYIPDVLSRVWDDIVVLVAISWTYIIIAELINKNDGGVGALIYTAQRQSRPDKMFALLIVIMLVGFLQDRLFRLIGELLFRHKQTATR
jgi:NitT/TauT family transport system permease protein